MKKLIYSAIAALAALSLLITAIFAWIVIVEKTAPIIISTGSLKTVCTLYYGFDSDDDGIIDDEEYTEITDAGIIFTNVIPGTKYCYKMVIKNKGTIDGVLAISVNEIEATHEDMYSGFSIRFLEPEEKDIFLAYGNILLFDELILESEASYEFLFTINANETISSELKQETLLITNFIVNLVQIKTT